MRLRGEWCVGIGSILTTVTFLLLVLVHVGQINTSTTPHRISMIDVDTSGFGAAINRAVAPNNITVYASNGSLPLQANNGIRQIYHFGLYRYCAYVDSDEAGLCGNHTTGYKLNPFTVMAADAPPLVLPVTLPIPDVKESKSANAFFDDRYLGQSSKAAYWMILIGTICTVLALITGILKHGMTYFLSTLFTVLAALMLLVAAAIWTTIFNKAKAINDVVLPGYGSLGITVSMGNGVLMTWAAFALMVLAMIPYGLSCCTYRG
ncbi:actin cortical patch SUR7/pH-response regulator pali [Panaeolus papilionaceus]|nr:actin cortical patch SUR7/pH-response regulator pali [Panaeolus papilionaceus]